MLKFIPVFNRHIFKVIFPISLLNILLKYKKGLLPNKIEQFETYKAQRTQPGFVLNDKINRNSKEIFNTVISVVLLE